MGLNRLFIGYIFGLFLALFGVFIFSDFNYLGVSMFTMFGSMDSFSALFLFFWIPFRANFFELIFSGSIDLTIFLQTFFPVIMSWFSAGIISGTITRGAKRSVISSFLIALTVFVLWLSMAIISGANMTFLFLLSYYETYGGILTALIFMLLGGMIGGLLSGKKQD